MAKTRFIDSAGREAWVDENNMVWTEGGNNPTYYTRDRWNIRQRNEWGSKSSSSSDKSPYQTYLDEMVEAQKKDIEERTSFLKDYTKNNALSFDEELAKQASSAEYSPYYDEMLDDFLKDIDLKRQTVEDDKRLTTELYTMDQQANTREFTRALRKAQQGYSSRGTFDSGAKEAGIGEATVENQYERDRAQLGYDARQRGYDRTLEGYDIDQTRGQRDIGRDKEAAIAGGVEQRRGEAMQQYNTNLLQSYARRFNPGDPAGYTIASYLKY